MVINKTKGIWSENATDVDDIVYMLYLEHNREKSYTVAFQPQWYIISTYKKNKLSNYWSVINDFYDEAVVINRRHKLEKLIKICELKKRIDGNK